VSAIAPSSAADVKPLFFAQAKTELIYISHAKAEELMTLKRIGEARAAAIIKGRPYAREDERVQKEIILESVCDAAEGKILATQ
jgi:DNA uptake protein ComE-like DNA-binding protein